MNRTAVRVWLDLISTLAWQQRKGDALKNQGFYNLCNAPAQPEAGM